MVKLVLALVPCRCCRSTFWNPSASELWNTTLGQQELKSLVAFLGCFTSFSEPCMHDRSMLGMCIHVGLGLACAGARL